MGTFLNFHIIRAVTDVTKIEVKKKSFFNGNI
jgi:hypothetical protein